MATNPLTLQTQPTHTADRSSHYCPACALAGTGEWQICPDCGTDFPPHAMLDDLRRNEYVCFGCTTSTREEAADIFGEDAVLFITEMDEGCLPGSDQPAPGARLFVGVGRRGLRVRRPAPRRHSDHRQCATRSCPCAHRRTDCRTRGLTRSP